MFWLLLKCITNQYVSSNIGSDVYSVVALCNSWLGHFITIGFYPLKQMSEGHYKLVCKLFLQYEQSFIHQL